MFGNCRECFQTIPNIKYLMNYSDDVDNWRFLAELKNNYYFIFLLIIMSIQKKVLIFWKNYPNYQQQILFLILLIGKKSKE